MRGAQLTRPFSPLLACLSPLLACPPQVEDPTAAAPFLPKLLPGLEKLAAEARAVWVCFFRLAACGSCLSPAPGFPARLPPPWWPP